METRNRLFRILSVTFIVAILALFVAPDIAEARRGGRSRSFGGSRRSKSTRTTKKPRATKPKASKPSVPKTKQSSFGGNRMTSSKQYTSKYGTPRKTSTYQGTNAAGGTQNYRMHNYGGFGSGLMTGYVMGQTSWMWYMPFHYGFYYGRPHYVSNADGSMDVYPPRFSFFKLFLTILVVGVIIYIIVAIIKSKRRRRSTSYSSFD